MSKTTQGIHTPSDGNANLMIDTTDTRTVVSICIRPIKGGDTTIKPNNLISTSRNSRLCSESNGDSRKLVKLRRSV